MVEHVSLNDFYEIRLASLLTNVDKDVIIELYQPLIGSIATILYLNLLNQKRNEDEVDVFSVKKLVDTMQVPPGSILNARHMLEGVSLISTYEKDNGDSRSYIFVLYAPKTPKEYFEDVLFKGLLVQAVGEKEARRLARKYQVDLKIPEEYKNISASFVDVFNLDYDDKSFTQEFSSSIVGRKTKKVKIDFNHDLFFKCIEENSQINKNSITKKEMKEIERLCALYSADEVKGAFAYIDNYDKDRLPHLDIDGFTESLKDSVKYGKFREAQQSQLSQAASEVSGDSDMAKKTRLMNSVGPVRYLKYLLGNVEPSDIDKDTINEVSVKYELPFGVINAIIDYTFIKCNKLNKKYFDSVAMTIKRENLLTAVDTLNYLNSFSSKKTKKVTKKVEPEFIEEPVEKKTNKQTEEISDEEMADILADINQTIGGKK